MTEEERDTTAADILAELIHEPTLGVPQIAEQLDLEPGDVAEILDSYFVTDGVPAYAGPGQGGGWIAEDIRRTLVSGYDITPENMGEHIGYRWPDGSVRETMFDTGNEEHRAEMGIVLPESAAE